MSELKWSAKRIEIRDGDIFVDGNPYSDEKFMNLLKEALNHRIVYQNVEKTVFCVEKQFGQICAAFPASAPCSLQSFISLLKQRLTKNGPVATLHYDDFYANRPL